MDIRTGSQRLIGILLLMCFLTGLFVLPARAESFTAEVVVNSMVVRSGPAVSYGVVARLSKGTRVTVNSYSGGLAFISFDGKSGYALVSDLSRVQEERNSSASISGLATVTASSCKIYTSPSTSSKVMTTLKRGQTFRVLSTDGTWAKLENGRYIGYCKMSNLNIQANVTPTPEPGAVQPTATTTPPAFVEPTPTGLATVKKNNTKIYTKASTSAKVMTTLRQGQTFTILDLNDTWAKLENGAYVGYVLRSGVTIHPGVTATPAITQTITPAPTPKPSQGISFGAPVGSGTVNVNLLYLYSQPDGDSAKLAPLYKGSKVTLYSKSSGWALVQYAGQAGYVKVDGLTINLGAEPLPTLAPNPTVGNIGETMSVPAFVNFSAPVYQSPSTKAKKLKTLAISTELTVLGHSGEWGLVSYGSTRGYMLLAALTRVSDATLQESMNATAKVSVSKATFYKYASSSSKNVGSLAKGAEVTVLATDSVWALVQYKGNKGYTTLSSLTEITNPTIAPSENTPGLVTKACTVYQYASTSSGKLTSLKADTELTILGRTSSWALIELGGHQGYVPASSITALSNVSLRADEAYTATVTQAGTVLKYMYSGSGSAGPVSKGLKVNVLAHTTQWALIEKNGHKGYFPVSNLQIQLDEFGSPTVKTLDATVVKATSVYATALESSQKLGSINAGEDITITAYTSKWVRISYGGRLGYLLKAHVSNADFTALKSGSSSSSDVLKLQKTLEDMGYFDGTPAGNYGSLTTSAVTRFQTQLGINATGVADVATLRVLYSGFAPESSIKSTSLSKGSIGTNVTRLQTRLTYKGYLSAGIDGEYGALTESAVKLYQKTAGLGETGSADSKTLASLFSSSAPKNRTSPISGASSGNNNGNASTGKYSTDAADDPSPGTGSSQIETVVSNALAQLGKPYIYGTSGTSSYDCSGLTCYAYRKIGISLGRSAYAQGYGRGTKIETVGALKRGDIVCMNTITDSDLSDHVGIYLGGGKFVHASSAAGKVIISSVTSGYYNRVFSWGRRIL